MNPVKIDIIFKRLCILMRLSTCRMPDIFDGVSAEDLPGEVLTEFLDSPNGLGWNPAKGPLDKFLLGILRHKMLDHLRRQMRTAGSLDDPDFFQQLKGKEKDQLSQMPQTLKSGPSPFRARLLRAVGGDPKLSEIVTAIENADDLHNINQQVADKLNTTPSDVVNRKKRIARKYSANGGLS